MNEQLRDQISAFLDSELSGAEGELLVRRLSRENGLYGVARRYVLIGQALRGESVGGTVDAFHQRVMLALDDLDGAAQPQPRGGSLWAHSSGRGPARWRRPLTGLGAAAAVALGAVMVLQLTQDSGGPVGSAERAAAYTVAPVADAEAVPDLRSGMPPIRLTNYLMSHGEYAGSLGRMSVQSGIVGTSAARAMGGYFERETQQRDEQ